MKKSISMYGKVAIAVIIAGAVIASFVSMGQKAREKQVEVPENNGNMEADLLALAEGGYYPYFEGLYNFTVKKNYVGPDGMEGLSREDVLEGVKAYEYIMENGTPTKKAVPKEKIKVYPYDEEAGAQQQSELIEPEVTSTGRYVLKYVIEGESGLNAEESVIVLVDYLPEGVERQNEAGGE